MQYLLSVYMDENAPQPEPEVIAKMYKDVDVVNNELQESGAWVFAGGLHPSSSATTVDATGSETLTVDGPFAETKEQLGGFWVIDVPDLDAALQWATKSSKACQARIEVRPFQGDSEA